jgi:hypothetical protein
MKLVDKMVAVKDIFLDPFNPRFIEQNNLNQTAVLTKIFSGRDAKELLSSMKIDIKWVNKLVLISISDLNETQKSIIGIDKAEYLVIEGNNRLACLKSEKIEGVGPDTIIPVLVAEKEENESQNNFEMQLRVTQGIANVMVVKEWSIISKARHLYKMYYDLANKEEHTNLRPHELFKMISNELGLKIAEVRQSIVRYEFYKTINEVSDTIPEDHWGYLEAFDRNKEIREKFGMSDETNKFKLDIEDEGYCEEILKEIPALIKKALLEGVNTKDFRDIIGSAVSGIDSSDELFEFINGITERESSFSFRRRLEEQTKVSEEEDWKNMLVDIKSKLQSYPTMSVWTKNQKEMLEELKFLLERHIGAI